MSANLVPCADGFNLWFHQSLSLNSYVLNSERSKKPRVFKTVEAAMIVCKKLEISQLSVAVA